MPALATRNSPMAKTISMRKELSVLVLLLAAETVAAGNANKCILMSQADGNHIGTVSTINSLAKEMPMSSETSSTGGETDSAGYSTPLPDGDAIFAAALAGSIAIDTAMISIILSYLPWKKVIGLRGINKAWMNASLSVAALCRMPGSNTLAAFIPCLRDFDASEEADEQAYMCNHGDTWKCDVCGFWNAPVRIMCGNRACQIPAPSHQSAVRIFLGQLRRSGTVSFIKWLADNIMDDRTSIMNVENHRHKVTGRGKGCAWAYVANETSAMNLLSFHRRLFLDTVGDVEGIWITKSSDISALDATVESRSFAGNQRARHLPRNSLVVELPSMSPAPQPHSPPSNGYYNPNGSNQAWGASYSAIPPQRHGSPVLSGAAPPPPYYCNNPYECPHPSAGIVVRQHQPYGAQMYPAGSTPPWEESAAIYA